VGLQAEDEVRPGAARVEVEPGVRHGDALVHHADEAALAQAQQPGDAGEHDHDVGDDSGEGLWRRRRRPSPLATSAAPLGGTSALRFLAISRRDRPPSFQSPPQNTDWTAPRFLGWKVNGTPSTPVGAFRAGDRCRVLPRCGHRFHAECVDSWLRKSRRCYVCRAEAVLQRKHAGAVAEAATTVEVVTESGR
jgi:hypothetical protein